MRNVELLAPAGTWESMVAAVQNGADAVYLSGTQFGARKFAGNFDKEQLIEAVAYCHIRGVKVFVTVNTLILDEEFHELKGYLDFLYQGDIDAVIVQDFGVMQWIHKHYPDWEIHASTQMSAHSLSDVRFLSEHGAKRVVVAREMSIEEIREIKNTLDVDLEVFVHGALCISYSGQCLLSSMIGGRSGNRGSCAQPCRQAYSMIEMESGNEIKSKGGDFLISPKDLNSYNYLEKVIAAGVDSLKIEGRMKRPEYVATVVDVYRKKIDGHGSEEEAERLHIFSRGFTEGHLKHARGGDLMSIQSPGNQGVPVGKVLKYISGKGCMRIALDQEIGVGDELQIRRSKESVGARVEYIRKHDKRVDVAYPGDVVEVVMKKPVKPMEIVYKTVNERLMAQAKSTYHKEGCTIPLEASISLIEGQPPVLILTDPEGRTSTATLEELVERAQKAPLDEEKIHKQISKMGQSAYTLRELHCELGEGVMVPSSLLNKLRREALEQMDALRKVSYPGRSEKAQGEDTLNSFRMESSDLRMSDFRLTAATLNLAQTQEALDAGIKTVYHSELKSLKEAAGLAEDHDAEIIAYPFRIMNEQNWSRWVEMMKEARITKVLGGSYGALSRAETEGFQVVIDYSMNALNSETIEAFGELKGVAGITVSSELNESQLSAIRMQVEQDLEIIGYGRMPVMVMNHCPVAHISGEKSLNCGLCEACQYGLKDRLGTVFPMIRREQCRMEIYNSKLHMLMEYYKSLQSAGINLFRLNFTLENAQEVRMIVELHQEILSDKPLDKASEAVMEDLKAKGVTYGHFKRGLI